MQNIETVLDAELKRYISKDNTLDGADYLRLFRVAYDHGFSNEEFKEYLLEKKVQVRSVTNENSTMAERFQKDRMDNLKFY